MTHPTNDRTLVLAAFFFGGLLMLAVGIVVALTGAVYAFQGDLATSGTLVPYMSRPLIAGIVSLFIASLMVS